MKCKFCRKEIDLPDALFCPYCGEKQVKSRSKREIKYPKYRILADGSLLGQLMLDGQRETVKARNETEYKAKVDALRAGLLDRKEHPEKTPLDLVIRRYIDKTDGILSPSTTRGYEIIYNNRFAKYMKRPICDIDFQEMIKEEIKAGKSPKTIRNAWGLVTTACKDAGIPLPEVHLPQLIPSDGDFLDFEQIQTFLAAVKGDNVECAALLMLHSLRISELLKLDAEKDIVDGMIYVRGAVVPNKNHKFVEKQTNKNRNSTRQVPIMIPRLTEVLPASGKAVTLHPSSIRRRIENICEQADLPICSPHDLRRSFASLAKHLKWDPDTTMRIGGWSNMQTVSKIYAKLAEKDKNEDVERMKNYYQITTASEKSSV